jgi:DNA-binding GntR family transcriptional regulator
MEEGFKIPQHRIVYESLRKQISEGVYKEGDLLPSENQLCILHGVTRPTVRKALDALFHEGYIKRRQGKGSIVRGLPQGVGILSIGGTTAVVGGQNLRTKIIVKPETRTWNSAFSFKLSDLETEAGCIYFERLRLLNEVPVFFDITMLPNIRIPRITSRSFENRSLFDILRIHYGIEIIGGEQQISATLADERLQNYFNVQPGHPILQLNRKLETNLVDYNVYSQVFCNTQDHVLYGTF